MVWRPVTIVTIAALHFEVPSKNKHYCDTLRIKVISMIWCFVIMVMKAFNSLNDSSLSTFIA